MSNSKPSRGYHVWSAEEEAALREGVKKHGLGAWEIIRRDPELSILSHRSGVQLKDKFRNLVKFRHISLEESRTLKPKGSGPWSRKHSASGGGAAGPLQRERSLTRTPSGQLGAKSSDNDTTDEQQHAAALLALEAGKQQPDTSGIAGKRSGGFETGSEDPEGYSGMGEDSIGRRKRRRTAENRTFGIYDQRRYRADGRSPGDDDERTESEGEGRARSGGSSRQRRHGSRSRSSRRPRGRRNIEDSETTTEEDSDEEPVPEEDDEAPEEDHYVVDCPCGIKFDDGAMMVECESCKTWAHIGCLQQQAGANPGVIMYDFNNYVCLACQAKRNPAMLGLPGLAGLGVPSSRATKSNSRGRMPALGVHGMDVTGIGQVPPLDTRFHDRTHEAGNVLLGLANGDLLPGPGSLQRTGSKAAAGASKSGVYSAVPGSVPGNTPGLASHDYLESLSNFLRPNSAFGQKGATSPNGTTSGPASPPQAGGSRNMRSSGPSGPAGRSADLDGQQNLDKLLAAADGLDAANAAGSSTGARGDGKGGGSGGGAGGGSAVLPPLSSMAALSALARPASRGPLPSEVFGDTDDEAQHSVLSQILSQQATSNDLLQQLLSNRSATPSQLLLQELMRGTTPDIGLPWLQNTLQGATAAAAAAAAAAQLQFMNQQHGLSAPNSMMGADASGMPAVPHNIAAQALQIQAAMHAASQGAPGGHATAPSATMADGTTALASKATDGNKPAKAPSGLMGDDLAHLAAASAAGVLGLNTQLSMPEVRPGTPDTWALLRGSTPTPDAIALHSFGGIPPLASFPDPHWYLHRNSPALFNASGMDVHALAQLQQQQGAAGSSGGGAGPGTAQPVVKAEPGAGPADTSLPAAISGRVGAGQPPSGTANGMKPEPAGANGSQPRAAAGSGAQQAAQENGAEQRAGPQGAAAASASPADGLDMIVDRKSSLGALGSGGELAAAVAAASAGSNEENTFNVEDMLRANTPAPR